MKITYRHTNLVARDWKRLAAFYETVFGCEPVPPKRDLSGEWLDRATGVKNARIRGIHLRLPGHGPNGPTLEVFQYDRSEDAPPARANRLGFGHVAFEVEDVREALRRVVAHGGTEVGRVSEKTVEGVGMLVLVYASDPEGNIIELQRWA